MCVSEFRSPRETVSSHVSLPFDTAATVRPAVRHNSARNAATGSPRPVNGNVTPDSILRSFNTWAFKREQPDTVDSLRTSISKAVAEERPVPFVLYWGKGLRCNQAEADIQCLNFLNAMGERVREAHKSGVSFTLIFTDTHAELNGHPAEAIQQYFHEVSESAGARDFLGCTLSDIVAKHGTPSAADAVPPAPLLAKLHASASRWYRGDEPVSAGAKKYYEMNMIEKAAVQAAFPDSIFITFNGSDMRPMFPDDLPIFYMYSLKRGTSIKPWFLPALECPRPVEDFVSAE